MCLFSYCVVVLKIAACFFLHRDSAAAETTIWIKLFCQTNDKLMDTKHSSLGQAAEFTSISENILFSHISIFYPCCYIFGGMKKV